jgi:hypothetical protein
MNVWEMESMPRINAVIDLEAAVRYMHAIEALIAVRNNYVLDPDLKKGVEALITRRMNDFSDRLACIANTFGLALVNKTVLAEGEVQL